MQRASHNSKGKRGRHQRTQSQVRKISASVSRSIGDMIAHEYGGLISEPEITIHTLNLYHDSTITREVNQFRVVYTFYNIM